MWPLSVISDKLSKMIGDRGEGDEGQELAPEALISFTRQSHYVDVPHVRQLFHWDCGLACVLMVLKTLGIDRYDIHDLEKLCHTTSIWTVDLAYLLHNFSVDFSFFTVTVGVNPNYSAENFYREQLQDDIVRVDELFSKALHAGISIQSRSIRAEDIAVLLLSGHCIAVALVDKTKLSHSWMNDIDDTECYSGRSDYMVLTEFIYPCALKDHLSSYRRADILASVGHLIATLRHYVVICGYDADTGEFEIRDPAISRKHERVSMECLDEARKSFGTDEDILLVSLNGKDGHKVSSRLLM